jgi:transposase-like protein
MELHQLSRLQASLLKAPIERVLQIESIVRALIERRAAEANLAKRTAATIDARRCPHCATSGAMLHGKDKNGRQRFRCVSAACRRTYNILTGTPMARARKPEKWAQYVGCMSDHLSLRKIIERHVTINLRTAFRWRHRFLKAAQGQNAALLSGVIEADETYFVQSFKGSRGWKLGKPPAARAARPSGWGATMPGLSHQQVPVLTALDNAGAVYEAVLASRAAIEPALDGRIAAGSVLCSDGVKAYVKVAVRAGAEHRRVEIAQTTYVTKMVGRPRRKGRLGLGHVNAHHGRLKAFINVRCLGVATKYLGSYLAWNRAMSRDGFNGAVLLDYALA